MPFFNSDPKTTLLIDIGGTSVKSKCLEITDHESFLRSLKAGCFGWVERSLWQERGLLKTLQDLIERTARHHVEVWKSPGGHVSPIRFIETIDLKRIRVSITDHTQQDSRRYRGYLTWKCGLPEKLAEQMEQWAGNGWYHSCGSLFPNQPIALTHDSQAWALGFQRLLNDDKGVTRDPVSLLVVGTGISFVKVSRSLMITTKIEVPELSDATHDWQKLRERGGWGEASRAPHNHLAKLFFDWLDSQGWNDDRVNDEINVRTEMLLKELERVHGIRRFVFAGGYGERFSNIATKYHTEVLTQKKLGFDPDFIPMLGLL